MTKGAQEVVEIELGRRVQVTEGEKRAHKSQASGAEMGTLRAPTGWRNTALRLCQKTETSREIGQLWRERPREAFSYMEVHSHDAHVGLCLEMRRQVLLWDFFPTEGLSQLLGFQ